MEKVAWVTLLYDFYGQLLTEKQQKFLELYYEDDLSLGEIADKFTVSRQAVHDSLKRAVQILVKYEEELGLAANFTEQRSKVAEALALAEEFLLSPNSVDGFKKIKQIKELLLEIMETVKK
ncbi:YlxM family DNA-binding protein [Desulfofarcimen acetoxidans]|uniref:YlxM family DNA-binding protein n=1 Tax=Desulfofarcimen acetoxidans TaxID=58138 RepID=UPI0005A63F9E